MSAILQQMMGVIASSASAGGGGPGNTGKTLCGTGEDSGTGGDASPWVTPANIAVILGPSSYATEEIDGDEITDYLVARNFGFAIPSGATILGIETFTTAREGSGHDMRPITAIWNSGSIGTEKSAYAVTTADHEYTQGSSVDMWGLVSGSTITDTIVNSPAFGFALRVQEWDNDNGSETFIKSCYMTVYYTS